MAEAKKFDLTSPNGRAYATSNAAEAAHLVNTRGYVRVEDKAEDKTEGKAATKPANKAANTAANK